MLDTISYRFHLFHSMSIDPNVPENMLYPNLISKSKVKVMGEVEDQSHKLGSTSNRLTSFPFHINRSHLFVPWGSVDSFLRYVNFNIWPWKCNIKVVTQGHNRSKIVSTNITFVPSQWTFQFLRYSFFKILFSKSKVSGQSVILMTSRMFIRKKYSATSSPKMVAGEKPD